MFADRKLEENKQIAYALSHIWLIVFNDLSKFSCHPKFTNLKHSACSVPGVTIFFLFSIALTTENSISELPLQLSALTVISQLPPLSIISQLPLLTVSSSYSYVRVIFPYSYLPLAVISPYSNLPLQSAPLTVTSSDSYLT